MHKPQVWISTVTMVYMALGVSLSPAKSPSPAATEEREALIQADRDFDKATAEKGVEGWISCFGEDARMFPAGSEIVIGKAAIREAMAPVFAAPGSSLRWNPLGAEVSRAGDLGYTFGLYVARSEGANGEPVVRHGKYVTVWRKQADGSWKVVLDIGNASPPPARP